jgi:hypothetical protein
MYMLWREGVDAVFWYNIRDRTAPVFMWLSGLFTHENSVQHDTPKPAYTGFRFPFVAVRSGGHTLAWGRARSTQDPVIVEQRKGNGGWKQVAKFTVGKGLVYLRTVSSPGNAVLRARQGSLTSLSFQVTTAVP